MPDDTPTGASSPTLLGALELLERSVSYARSSLQLVRSDVQHAATPCRGWDLGDLLHHMDDSLSALQDAADLGRVAMVRRELPDADDAVVALVERLKTRACALLGAWTANDGADLVSVAGCPLTAHVLLGTGAVEIAVHGWDVAWTCGDERPMPAGLASALSPLLPVLVSEADRGRRFAAPVSVPPWASPGDRVVAALGRQPWRSGSSEAV
jgi:uncharacterized protein (TIGR03086 family)